MSDGIPEFHLARVYSDGHVEPLIYPVGPLPLDTISDRRGLLLGGGLVAAGALASATTFSSALGQGVSGGPAEGASQCFARVARTPRDRAHDRAIVQLAVDETAGVVATRDFSGRIKIWNAAKLTLERSLMAVPLSMPTASIPHTAAYFLQKARDGSITGKVVYLAREYAAEVDLVAGSPTVLIEKNADLTACDAASFIHFIHDRLFIAVVGRTLTYFDMETKQPRLQVRIPGDGNRLVGAVSHDRQWLALLDDDSVQLWHVHQGVRLWVHRLQRPSQPTVDPANRATAVPASAIGFLTGDKQIIAVDSGRRVTIHDRATGELMLGRTLTDAAPAAPAPNSRAAEISDTAGDDGLKVLWQAGGPPALWTLRTLERKCTLPIDRPTGAGATNYYGIVASQRRGFATEGDCVSVWDLERRAHGGFLKDPTFETVNKPNTPSTPSTSGCPSHTNYGVGGVICTCNKVCTCVPIPICQAHELLHEDPSVRAMAEETLLRMGRAGLAYMRWAASVAHPELAGRIHAVMANIDGGRTSDPARWPDPRTCVSALSRGGVVAVMAAQWMRLRGLRGSGETDALVTRSLHDALLRPWTRLRQTDYRAKRVRTRRVGSDRP